MMTIRMSMKEALPHLPRRPPMTDANYYRMESMNRMDRMDRMSGMGGGGGAAVTTGAAGTKATWKTTKRATNFRQSS